MDGYTPERKRHIVRFTAKTRAGVLDKLRAYRAEMESGARIDKKVCFSDWADTWYGDYKSEVQPSTYSGYQYTLKALKIGFGEQPLAEILPIHINRFLDKLSADGYSLSDDPGNAAPCSSRSSMPLTATVGSPQSCAQDQDRAQQAERLSRRA